MHPEMDNIDDVILAVCVGALVADFLLNTNRVIKAIELWKECLILIKNRALEKEKEFVRSVHLGIYIKIFYAYIRLTDHTNGIEWGRKLLIIMRGCSKRSTEGKVTFELALLYQHQSEFIKAQELYEKALCIMKEIRDIHGEATCYINLGTVFRSLSEYAKAKEYLKKALNITKEIGAKEEEACCYGNLGTVFKCVGEYVKAEKCHMKALSIRKEFGDTEGEAADYGNLGNVYLSLGKYAEAEKYHKKALAIKKETGHKQGEATCYGNLGLVFLSLSEYAKAEEHFQKAVVLNKKTGDRQGEAANYVQLGLVFKSLGEYAKAKENHEKALAIMKQIGDRQGEAVSYGCLGVVLSCSSEYVRAIDYFQKALKIRKEVGDKAGEASDYGNLGAVFKSLGKYTKAREYLEKALAIRTEIGEKSGVASDYGHLGTVFIFLGDYVKAEEYIKKELAIKAEIGDKRGVASAYGSLGHVFKCLGEYAEALEYQKQGLAITKEIGDRSGEAKCYINLGTVFNSLGEHIKAKEYLNKALTIEKELGNRHEEAVCYESIGNVCQSLGEYVKSEEYHKKALSIAKEIGYIEGECTSYRNLGTVFLHLGKDAKAKEYHDKALAISKEIGDVEAEIQCYVDLAFTMVSRGNIQEAFSNLIASIQKCEDLRVFQRSNDNFKISFSHMHVFPYRMLGSMFGLIGDPHKALYVVELGRARALADLLSAKYLAEKEITVNQQEWFGIDEKIMEKEGKCSCLYSSYFGQDIFMWIIQSDKPLRFRITNVNESITGTEGSVQNLDVFFGKQPFRGFLILPQEQCEDRSLPLYASHSIHQSLEDNFAALRLVEEEDEEDEAQEPEPTLALYYKMIIAPVAELLDESEILIVPDRALYKVPFAALKDESGKFLSETFRIRIIPSLTTLKLIQERTKKQCSDTDVLIVGDPDVSNVIELSQLPCARKEAEMIGGLLGAQPLLGHQATKLAVLEMMHSASLIHFAAHGDAERGEIALAPVRPINRILHHDDYVLTMSDVARVQLRAKLVVLSCCHSGLGQIKAEGVVGIARAFLGSGARSVLAALWAIEDEATEQFMSSFYEHLVRGESASESLHQAMKWMRGNGFSDVRQWAPFMLIGDNVTFNFGK